MTTRRELLLAAGATPIGVVMGAQEQPSEAPASALFAVEFHTGPAWIAEKPATEQAYFQEHMASLNRLRQEGRLVAGVRYADKALMILSGPEASQLRRELDLNPAVTARVFLYEIHPLRVHFAGCLSATAR